MPRKHIQKEEAESIIAFYSICNSITETAQNFNRGFNTIQRLLTKQKIKTNNYLSEEEKNQIIELYRDGNSIPAIRRKTNRGDGTIYNLIKDLPYKRETTLYGKVRTNYFENLSEETAYFIGLILADGSISENNKISITLHNKDKDILQKYCDFLHLDHSHIRTFQSKPEMGCVRFSNEAMVNTLSKYNIVANKVKITSLPQLPEELMPHLIRGIFDGDGHVSRYSTYISGSKQLIEDLNQYLTFIPHYTYYQENTDVWYIRGKGRLGRRLFLEYIYRNASTYMERKYKSYESFYGPVQ